MKYGIENGQVYLAADGSKCGHYVIDCQKHAHCDDVVTKHFSASGIFSGENIIDAFKLARVRYSLCTDLPDWARDQVNAIREKQSPSANAV